MAGAISINVAANVRDAVRGVDNVADAVEEVSDRLRDMTKDSDQSADRLERDFKEVQRSTDKTSDDIKRKFREAYKSVGRASDDAADDAVRAQRHMSEQASEYGSEIRQNLGEGLANAVRGDFSQLGDTIGDTIGGTVAGIGGIGTAAAAIATGVGIGAITAAFIAADEKRKELQARASDLADAYIEAGTAILDTFGEVERAQAVISDPEQKKKVEDYAKALGVDLPVALGAYVGRSEDLDKVQQIIADRTEENTRLTKELGREWNETGDAQYSANLDAIEAGTELIQVQKDAADGFQTWSDYLNHVAESTEGATAELDEFGDTIVTLPDGKQIYIDAETGQATDKTDAIEKKIYGIQNKDVSITAHTVIDDSALRNYRVPFKIALPTYFQTPNSRQLLP